MFDGAALLREIGVCSAMTRIRLDIVSDIVCPWCVIGYKRLELAMRELADEMEFEIEWRPFELNPDMPPEGEDAGDHIVRKYGISREQAEENRQRIAMIGRELGVAFLTGEGRRIYNTFDAPRIMHWAREQGAQTPLSLALFHAYFTEGRNPSDPEVLRQAAESVGLNGAAVIDILGSDRYRQEVRAEEHRYTAAGIRSVPAYIINNTYLISGGQEPATFVKALRQIAAE
jgi:predicted DsbA family dithiol-disulfide isomerase